MVIFLGFIIRKALKCNEYDIVPSLILKNSQVMGMKLLLDQLGKDIKDKYISLGRLDQILKYIITNDIGEIFPILTYDIPPTAVVEAIEFFLKDELIEAKLAKIINANILLHV